MSLNIEDAELKLQLGLPIEIEGLGSVHSPKVKTVAKIGENKYNNYLSSLLFNKENVDVELASEASDFQIFCLYYDNVDNFKETVDRAFDFFMNAEVRLHLESECFYFVSEDVVGQLNGSNFFEMQESLRLANSIKKSESDEDKYDPADEETAKMIAEMLERRRNKPKPKPTIDLRSIISGMSWKCPSVDISEKTIFQLYDGYKRLQNIDSLHYTMFGVYTGNVDMKKLNMQELNFALILKD